MSAQITDEADLLRLPRVESQHRAFAPSGNALCKDGVGHCDIVVHAKAADDLTQCPGTADMIENNVVAVLKEK